MVVTRASAVSQGPYGYHLGMVIGSLRYLEYWIMVFFSTGFGSGSQSVDGRVLKRDWLERENDHEAMYRVDDLEMECCSAKKYLKVGGGMEQEWLGYWVERLNGMGSEMKGCWNRGKEVEGI